MKKRKLISVILPVYNSENTISETINSILEQSYDNFEIIIVNDGSSDKSENIIKEKMKDKRIIYIKNDNHGVSYSRNYALNIARGEYITFIDSDDIYKKNYLEELYQTIELNNADLAICSYTYFNCKEKNIYHGKDFISSEKNEVIEELYPTFFNQLWNKIYLTSIIKENNLCFDEDKSIAEDLIFNIKYIEKTKVVAYVDKNLYKYRITDKGLGFKFRLDANDIKIYTVELLEKLYIDNNYNMEFIYKNYIVQYIAYITRICDKRNAYTTSETNNEIYYLINSDRYKNNLKKVYKSSNIKYKIAAKILLNKSIISKKIIAFVADKYDKMQKKKIFIVMK